MNLRRTINNLIKYIFDRVAGIIGLTIAIPVLIVISFVIIINDGFPVFFIQKRVGYRGKLFSMIKFRTMVKNDGKNTVSVKGDKRITKTGAFLRRYKMDELPELINVCLGQMSFVGPRPDVPGYADQLAGEDRLILKLRPGVTGPATLKYVDEETLLAGVEDPVAYNDQVIYPDKVRINLKYYHQHTLLLDLKIIFATVLKKQINF